MTRFTKLLHSSSLPSSITPLFWQHGESEEVLREEIRQMHSKGIGGFILESRPHPDFLGTSWWEMLRIVIDEAKQHQMKVYVFDDSTFPSGYASGRIRDKYPEYLKVYLREDHIDAEGPRQGSSFLIKSWIKDDEQLVRVVAARRTDGVDQFDADSLLDLTSRIMNGILYWDIPEGFWRVYVFVRTREGGEEGTKDYLNPLDQEPVKAYLDEVYEAHYSYFPIEFGKTFAGFFSDEPRFGNAATYEARIGHWPMVLPYSDTLLDELSAVWGKDFGCMLPCLWYLGGTVSAEVRYTYMEVVSRRYAKNFTQQIGDWCRAHDVRLIGHVVEDNGAHTRLGYGSGHFFRAIHGQDVSGMDIVYQVWPEYTGGRVATPFGYLDADFFYWGLAKMASSAGHIDPKKKGMTVCEIFGAYGWQCGLKLMKWLTDFVCVRGVNCLIPHAFSPRFPDRDCPPHFFALGHNPQWRHFAMWSNYANRLCYLLSGGTHIAPVAVIYHAEAEWCGDYEPFEKVVKNLALHQIDTEVLPLDALIDPEISTVEENHLRINQESYQVLVVPYSEALPEQTLERLLELAEHRIHVIFMQNYPSRTSLHSSENNILLQALKEHSCIFTTTHDQLVALLKKWNIQDFDVADEEPSLRVYHYQHRNMDEIASCLAMTAMDAEAIYFLTNESKYRTVETRINFREKVSPIAYDAMRHKTYRVQSNMKNDRTEVTVRLEPFESIFLIFGSELGGDEIDSHTIWPCPVPANSLKIEGPWQLTLATAEQYPVFEAFTKTTSLGNLALPDMLPDFSGTIRYETRFDLPTEFQTEDAILELGAVYEIVAVKVNEQDVGMCICPPYHVDVTHALRAGRNVLQIEVTNTLSKALGDNVFDRAMPQEPTGLLGPVRLMWA